MTPETIISRAKNALEVMFPRLRDDSECHTLIAADSFNSSWALVRKFACAGYTLQYRAHDALGNETIYLLNITEQGEIES